MSLPGLFYILIGGNKVELCNHLLSDHNSRKQSYSVAHKKLIDIFHVPVIVNSLRMRN